MIHVVNTMYLQKMYIIYTQKHDIIAIYSKYGYIPGKTPNCHIPYTFRHSDITFQTYSKQIHIVHMFEAESRQVIHPSNLV